MTKHFSENYLEIYFGSNKYKSPNTETRSHTESKYMYL